MRLVLGSDASFMSMKMGLKSECYYVGEAVAVKRSDGRTTVAMIYQIDNVSECIICHVNFGIAKNIPFHEIPWIVGKLIGLFCIENSLLSQPKALVLGRDSNDTVRTTGLGLECFYKGEAVSIRKSDGRSVIGHILSIDAKSVAVGLGDSHIVVPAAAVSTVLSKLIGLFCISAEDKANHAFSQAQSVQNHRSGDCAGDQTRLETICETVENSRNEAHIASSELSLSNTGGEGSLQGKKEVSIGSHCPEIGCKQAIVSTGAKSGGEEQLQASASDKETISTLEQQGNCAVNPAPDTLRLKTAYRLDGDNIEQSMTMDNEDKIEETIKTIHEVWLETAWKESLPVSISSEAIVLLLKMERLAESERRGPAARQDLIHEKLDAGKVQAELLSLAYVFLRVCLPLHMILDGQRKVAAVAEWICERTKHCLPQCIALNDFASLFLNAFREEFCNHLSTEQAKDPPKRMAADGADCGNAKQIAQLSVPLTIWNAVSCFGTRQGKASWRLARAVVSILGQTRFECPWMSGAERGVFGETPLHVAVLFNGLDLEFEDMFFFLWDRCPQLQACAYQGRLAAPTACEHDASLYEGENLLHLAVIRRFGAQFIRKLRQSKGGDCDGVWKALLAGRATGKFFKDPALSGGYCNMLGELPVCFAACSNQADVFEYLIENGAEACETSGEGNNLLHLIVLNDSLDNVRSEAAAGEIHARLFKSIRRCLPKGAYEALSDKENNDGFTPLLLAAAHGSPKMFSLLFDEVWIKAAWTYGPVTCKRMLLDGVDVPLDPPTGRRDSGAFASFRGGGRPAKRPSILEVLVDNGRGDILFESHISQLIEAKWRTYGDRIFRRMMVVSLLLAVAVFFLPLLKVDAGPALQAVHVGLFLASIFVSERMFVEKGGESNSALFRYLFHVESEKAWALSAELRGAAGWISSIASVDLGHVLQQVYAKAKQPPYPEEVLADFLPPILKVLFLVYVGRAAVLPAITPLIPSTVWENPTHAAATGGHDRSWSSAAAEALAVTLSTGEAVLYCAVSLLTFANLASLVLVFERLGCFAFVLARTVRNDLPSFAAVYGLFLLAFAHIHFLASNPLHAGVAEGVDSVWRIFGAMLGEFMEEDKSVCRYSATVVVVTGVTVANYFLSTVVLVNLLIAMLGRTYDASREEVKKEWRLHRASVVVKIDRRMTANQRQAKDKLFWLSGIDGTR